MSYQQSGIDESFKAAIERGDKWKADYKALFEKLSFNELQANTETAKWKSLAGELMFWIEKMPEHPHDEKCGCPLCEVLAKAREAGL